MANEITSFKLFLRRREFEKHQAMKRDVVTGSCLVHTLRLWTKVL